MKNYLDLQDIDTRLNLVIELEPVGTPATQVIINDKEYDYPQLLSSIIINDYLPLIDNINIDVIMSDKQYTLEYETAVIIKLSIDNIEIIPKYNHLIKYNNDQNCNTETTNYLGFNGKWSLTIDRPFYHWLHEHSGQGWLIG
jgi:hypothetical protein